MAPGLSFRIPIEVKVEPPLPLSPFDFYDFSFDLINDLRDLF